MDIPAITAPAARILFQSMFFPPGWATARATLAIAGSAAWSLAEAAMQASIRGGQAGQHHPPGGDLDAAPRRRAAFLAARMLLAVTRSQGR